MASGGSWRDQPERAPDGAADDDDEDDDEDECASVEFEPFSDSCSSDLDGLDLALFEPAGKAAAAAASAAPGPSAAHKCCQCAPSVAVFSQLYILTERDKEPQIGHRPANALKEQRVPLVAWEPYFCVLLQDEQTLTAYRSEELSIFPGTPCRPRGQKKIGDSLFVELPRVRLDGGAKAFRQRWGYEPSPPPPLLEEDEASDGAAAALPDTASLHSPPTGTSLY